MQLTADRQGPTKGDRILLAQVSTEWRKAARVVGDAMSHIDNRPNGIDDSFPAVKLKSLKERDRIESFGDLSLQRSQITAPATAMCRCNRFNISEARGFSGR